MILSADIGGTKSNIALSSLNDPFHYIRQDFFQNDNFSNFDQVLKKFIESDNIKIMVLGIAGPISGDIVELTNLNWVINSHLLEERYSCKVFLLNDLEAAIYSIPNLDKEAFNQIRKVNDSRQRITVLAAVGTGLGVSKMHTEETNKVFASEGGHIGFSPKSQFQQQFYDFIFKNNEHVSYEMIASSVGLSNLKKFLKNTDLFDISDNFKQQLDQTSNISRLINQTAKTESREGNICQQILNEFSYMIGSFLGDIALIHLPENIYLTGGLGRNIVVEDELEKGFLEKGRMKHIIENINLSIILDPNCGLKGATSFATHIILDENYSTP